FDDHCLVRRFRNEIWTVGRDERRHFVRCRLNSHYVSALTVLISDLCDTATLLVGNSHRHHRSSSVGLAGATRTSTKSPPIVKPFAIAAVVFAIRAASPNSMAML